MYGTQYGASSLAADTMLRYLFSAATPLFSVQWIDAIGFRWVVSILGFAALLLAPAPYLIYLFGAKLRARSRYVPA